MGTKPTVWHVLLATMLTQNAPRKFEVRSEVPLSTEPLRADYLLLRRKDEGTEEEDSRAGTFKHLWPLLPKTTIVEYKSIGRPYRSRNLDRLFGYLHLYYGADEPKLVQERSDLCGVLLVPSHSRTLAADLKALGLKRHDLGSGYWRLVGAPFGLYLAEIGAVADAEDDDLLRWFSTGEARSLKARRWLSQQVGAGVSNMSMRELEGFDEVVQGFLSTLSPEERLAGLPTEERLAGVPPKERLAGLPPEQVLAAYEPEQRLAGLPPEQMLLALPVELLRGFSDACLETLSPQTRAAIRARLGR